MAVEQRQHAQVLRAARLTAANRLPLPDERFPQRFSCDSRRAARACKSCGPGAVTLDAVFRCHVHDRSRAGCPVRPGRELAAAERSSSECVTGLVAEPGQWRASEAVTVAGNVDASRRASVNDAGTADSGPGPTMPPQASRPHDAEIHASPPAGQGSSSTSIRTPVS